MDNVFQTTDKDIILGGDLNAKSFSFLPQAGNNPVTVSDRVKAPVSSAGPTDSGGGQQPHVQTVENKESAYAKPLIHKAGYFSSNMARRNSVGDPLNTKKRKVMDTSIDLTQESVPYKKDVSKEFLLLQEALSSTKELIKELGERALPKL